MGQNFKAFNIRFCTNIRSLGIRTLLQDFKSSTSVTSTYIKLQLQFEMRMIITNLPYINHKKTNYSVVYTCLCSE